MAAPEALGSPSDAPPNASSFTPPGVDHTDAGSTPPGQLHDEIDRDLAAIQERVKKLERIKELQERAAQLEAELGTSSTGSKSKHQRHSSSPSSDERGEIKLQNIPLFALEFSLQKRQEWILDLQHVFKGAPRKYRTESKRILKALGHMQPVCRQRWYRYIAEKPAAEQLIAEESWSHFENWTLTLLRNTATLETEIMSQLERARQRNDQDPREFHAYLDTLEQHFPRKPEKERSLAFFAKLDRDLSRYIREHVITLPETRDEIVTLATHYWELSKPTNKRKSDDSMPTRGHGAHKRQRTSRRRSPQGAQGNTNSATSTKDEGNPTDEDGKRLRCFICRSDQHLANKCPERPSVQSTTSRSHAKNNTPRRQGN